ncbi:MAG: peptide chain release factor 1, partial [Deltaproteobacteria bacterium]
MFDKLRGVEKRFSEVETILSDPDIIRNREAYQKHSREHAELNKIVTVFRAYKQIVREIDDSLELMKD